VALSFQQPLFPNNPAIILHQTTTSPHQSIRYIPAMMLRAAVAPPPRLYLNLIACPRTITSLLPVLPLPQFRTAHSSHKKNNYYHNRHSPKPAVPQQAAEPITIPIPILLSAYQSGASPLSPSAVQALINDYAGRTTSPPSEALGGKFCSGLFCPIPSNSRLEEINIYIYS